MNKHLIQKLQLAFIAIIVVGLFIPLAGMTVAKTESSAENRSLAKWPELFVDGKFNENILSEAGAYFEDHYAFKEPLVNLDTRFNVSLFQNAENEKVIVGSKEWLYYYETEDDYTGINQMSDAQLATLAYNLSLLERYVEQHDAEFLVTFAPNKNTVYPAYMPNRYLKTTSEHNIERFKNYAFVAELSYLDLANKLIEKAADSEIDLYYKRDTHWNAYGASIAYEVLLDTAHIPHQTISLVSEPYVGDLWTMLYPGDQSTLSVPCKIKIDESMYTKETDDTQHTTQITNKNPNVAGKLTIIGDSFTRNSLLEELCTAFKTTTYADRNAINDIELLLDSSTTDLFIYECVERYVPALSESMWRSVVFPSLKAQIDVEELIPDSQEPSQMSIEMTNSGRYLQLSGTFSSPILSEEDILQSSLVLVVQKPNGQRDAYLPYRTNPSSGENGFIAYFADEQPFESGTTIELYKVRENTPTALAATAISK